MIIVRLIGGLGNQMFQYALGRHLAEKNSTLLKLDLTGFETYKLHRYGLHCFKIWEYIASIEEIETFKHKDISSVSRYLSNIRKRLDGSTFNISDFYQNRCVVKENQPSFDPSVLEAKGNIYLEGYWQSEKYFSDIRDFLKWEFSFRYEQDVKSKDISEHINLTNSVSLHIRRGDYVNNQAHGLCSFDYYQNAITFITKKIPNCHFYIFADDHDWVRKNFKIDYPVTLVDHNDASRNFQDLRLMSLCNHHIIANSSFSWWGAWLGEKPDSIIIVPSRWFSDLPSPEGLVPERWVKI